MDEDHRVARLERLEPLVGEWRLKAPAFPLGAELADAARTTFEWTLGGAFMLQRSSVPVPEAPDGLSVIGPDAGDGYTQHYFDSRGIARIYAMTFDARDWTLERHTPDFSPLPFHQRWLGTFTADGDTINGPGRTRPTATTGSSTSSSPTSGWVRGGRLPASTLPTGFACRTNFAFR